MPGSKRLLMTLGALSVAANMLASCMTEPVAVPPPAEPRTVATTPVALTAQQISVIQRGIKDSLKDPGSAQFGEMKAGKDSAGEITVCGYVNAKNSFGGYTGRKPFVGSIAPGAKAFIVAGMGGTDIETRAVFMVCKQYGIDLML